MLSGFPFPAPTPTGKKVPGAVCPRTQAQSRVGLRGHARWPSLSLRLPQHRHRIVTAYAFCCWCVGFEAIRPTPKVFEPSPVPNQWIERCQKSDLPRQIGRGLPVSDRRPDISHAIDGLPFQFSGSKQCVHRSARIAPTTIAGNRRSQTLLRSGARIPAMIRMSFRRRSSEVSDRSCGRASS